MANNNIQEFEMASVRLQVNYDEYYDLYLSEKSGMGYCFPTTLDTNCLISYIDFTKRETYENNTVKADTAYTYEEAVTTEDYTLYNIGSVGVDNGLIDFDITTIREDDFYNLFANSTLSVPPHANLILTKVSALNGKKSSLNNKIEYQEEEGAKFDGSYFQGFFQTLCDKYKVLPTELEDCWHWEFVLKGNGTFFYIGTRAENKWWRYYGHYDYEVNQLDKRECDGLNNDKEHYISPSDTYFADDYLFNDEQEDFLSYFADDYIQRSTSAVAMNVKDEFGNDLGIPLNDGNSSTVFETDNKFLLFGRGCEQYTTKTYNGEKYTYYYARHPYNENLFLKLNRGKNCYNVDDLKREREISGSAQKYTLFKDLYNNAFSLSVTPNGAVEYKYLVANCDETHPTYKIESEHTKDGIIDVNKFNVINVKVRRVGSTKMKIYFYINGYLNFISKELPLFNFRALDDMYEKQEGVPFNISLGGGTQGLSSVVFDDVFKYPCSEYILPLEKEFGKDTFQGNIKSFKFYDCDKEFMEIQGNYLWERKNKK